jgi:hypothetical protein
LGDFLFLGGTVSGGPVNTSAIGIRIVSTQGLPVVFNNFHLSGHTTADVQNASAGVANFLVDFKNCAMTSGTEISNQTTMLGGSIIRSTRHDQTNGNHLIWESTGTIKSDSTIFRTTPISLRLTPLSATFKIESRPFLIPVKESQTITVGVWVRTSVVGDGAAYNGNLPRLICKFSGANGTGSDDLILATASAASSGAWEYISGALPTSIDNAAFEVAMDCDGTAGWVNFDDIFVSSQNATKTMKYWVDGSPVPTITSQNGSSVIFL